MEELAVVSVHHATVLPLIRYTLINIKRMYVVLPPSLPPSLPSSLPPSTLLFSFLPLPFPLPFPLSCSLLKPITRVQKERTTVFSSAPMKEEPPDAAATLGSSWVWVEQVVQVSERLREREEGKGIKREGNGERGRGRWRERKREGRRRGEGLKGGERGRGRGDEQGEKN